MSSPTSIFHAALAVRLRIAVDGDRVRFLGRVPFPAPRPRVVSAPDLTPDDVSAAEALGFDGRPLLQGRRLRFDGFPGGYAG